MNEEIQQDAYNAIQITHGTFPMPSVIDEEVMMEISTTISNFLFNQMAEVDETSEEDEEKTQEWVFNAISAGYIVGFLHSLKQSESVNKDIVEALISRGTVTLTLNID